MLSDDKRKDMIAHMSAFSQANKFTKSITSLLVGLTADKTDLQLLKVAFS